MYGNITITLIVLTVIISLVGFRFGAVIDALIFWPPAITKKFQYYRFITCGFIHASTMHLLFNMLTLYFFGMAMEVLYRGELGLRPYYYLILYLAALVISNIPTFLKHRNDYQYRSLGASGAVSAVLFAFILLRPWITIYVFFLPVPAIIYGILFLVYSVIMSRKGGDHINHDAHFYGALFGVVFTIAAEPSVITSFIQQLKHPQFHF